MAQVVVKSCAYLQNELWLDAFGPVGICFDAVRQLGLEIKLWIGIVPEAYHFHKAVFNLNQKKTTVLNDPEGKRTSQVIF